jgi:hypothetical protein
MADKVPTIQPPGKREAAPGEMTMAEMQAAIRLLQSQMAEFLAFKERALANGIMNVGAFGTPPRPA